MGSQELYVSIFKYFFSLLFYFSLGHIYNRYKIIFQDRMIDIRSQPTIDGSTAPIDDEICDQVLGTRPYYVKGLGRGFRAPSSTRSSSSSRADIYAACHARMQEL